MATVLLEIGCEELPAAACRDAERQLPELVERELGAPPAAVYVGPRRLTVVVRDLAERTPDEWVKGPPVALRERAAVGFARKQGVAPEDLEEREGFLGVVRPGRALAEVLPERLDAVVRGLNFRKTMRWDESGLRWPRPVRWRLAKLDGESVAGFDGTSWGHRFTHGEVEIGDAESYLDALRAADVEPDQAERRRRIVAGLDALGEWSDPAAKLDEVVHLAEWPTVVLGSFDERFLELPERVVVTTMQSHQRYFPLGGAAFAVVINGGDPEVARRGHEQVLEARLQDASFTFERDVAKGIEGLAAELGSITFAAKAGTYADKAQRLVEWVERLGGDDHAGEAARLAKADQAAELVREFPDLEGHIGSVYARLAGAPEEVAQAIEDHYLPDGADAPLPRTRMGRILAAADKIDNLETNFRLGNKPTGSRDPFALRRAAIGLNRLAVEGGLSVRRDFLEHSADFVEERLEGLVDVPIEFVRAARASTAPDLAGIAAVARGLYGLDRQDLWQLQMAFDRAKNLSGTADLDAPDPVSDDLFEDPSEARLWDAQRAAETKIEEAMRTGEVGRAIEAAQTLPMPLDTFFEAVLVMHPRDKIRKNRRRLLADTARTLRKLADVSQLPRSVVARTPAIAAAEQAGIAYRLHEYEHDPKAESWGLEAAELLGWPPERVFKTLVVDADGTLTVALVPVDRELDLRALGKRARMAAPKQAERTTGYVKGGISPLGQRRRLPTVVDAAAQEHETILVNGGGRGLQLELAPADLVALTGATVAPIAR